MATIKPVSPTAWSELAGAFLDHNYRQARAYAEAAAARVGASLEHIQVRDGDEVIGAAIVRVRRAPLLGGVAYIAGGPLLRREGADRGSINAVFEALEQAFVAARGMTLRVMCPLGPSAWNDLLRTVLEERGYAQARWPRPYLTPAVSLAGSLDEIRSSFSKNFRKSLRRGETRGASVRESTDPTDFAIATTMHRDLIARKGFATEVDAKLLEQVQRSARGREQFILHIAEVEGEPVAINLLSDLGDTLTGVIGAMTPEAAPAYASYLLEWRAVELGHARGRLVYDLGGIDPEGNPGVAAFKRGLRGEELTAAGPLERRPSGARGVMLGAAEAAIRRARRIRRGGSGSVKGGANE